MRTLVLDKNYSEAVVRTAAAWAFNADDGVTIVLAEEGWIINTFTCDDSCARRLMQYINEIRLRELIDDRTGTLRKTIVTRALANVYGQ